MNTSARRVKGLGEVSIRVRDLDAMQEFFEEVVGLEMLRRDESFVFFKVAAGADQVVPERGRQRTLTLSHLRPAAQLYCICTQVQKWSKP